ncbi:MULTISPECIES: hypothetical protein [Acinetobacter]|nr:MULTISPECIES: hypothetical protein [Acinetobacter]EKU0940915.1 hypothetical protein [Acinetobacter baumannii]EKU8586201.1 hypothetical protein [Acinetobacter baumannii]EKV5507460.1 hypothetical protein [Acinetobacter baumannii]EKV7758691.1 hypothetical protein [Acinetobacter baumannii]EKV9844606.1 hypothetical protein [Acinetobacter baumannii]
MNRNKNLTYGHWWECEVNVLITMLEDKRPVHFIAEVLTRDYHGVKTKIDVLLRNGRIPLELVKKPKK